jgi:hypothetical protein
MVDLLKRGDYCSVIKQIGDLAATGCREHGSTPRVCGGLHLRGDWLRLRVMTIKRFVHYGLSMAILLCSTANPVAAQQVTTDELRKELAELRAEIKQLRTDLDALREPSGKPESDAAAVQPSLELLQTQVAELSQVKVESTSRMPVKLFGTIHTHVFANSGDANWMDIPNVVNPVMADGHSGSLSATLRQTRLGLTVDGPTLGSARTGGVVAMDFFGGIPGFVTGQVMGLPRLLVAFARVETDRTALEIGQDHMMLAPLDPTSLAGFSFPILFRSGNLYLRTPQVRVERAFAGRFRVMGGIVSPIAGDLPVAGAVPSEDYRFVPATLNGERSRRPAVQARLAFTTAEADAPRRFNLGVSSHYGWEFKGGSLTDSTATAFDFSVRRDVIGAAGEVFIGRNIDAFGGAVGLDAAQAGGGWAEVQIYPSNHVTLVGGGGLDDLRGTPAPTLSRHRNRSAYGNVILTLTPEVQASFEYRWLATQPGSGAERRNHHFDWTVAYKY